MDPRFPIGPFQPSGDFSREARLQRIGVIASLPELMTRAVQGLSDDQLETRYRVAGWTIRQVVHHVADSNLNAYTRFRLALTEDCPTIRPYDEVSWATLPDAMSGPVAPSLMLLEGMCERWAAMLLALPASDFERSLIHPDIEGELTVDWLLDQYAWHGRHHVAHITTTRDREGW